jgi:hypothetical protein
MPKKKFTVVFKSGDIQTFYAAAVDSDAGESRYLFFRDENGVITERFEKSVLAEWREG